MVIYSSIAAMSVLNEANRQNNKLSTTMQKVAAGLKVRGAEDDASAYSISEKNARADTRPEPVLGKCQ